MGRNSAAEHDEEDNLDFAEEEEEDDSQLQVKLKVQRYHLGSKNETGLVSCQHSQQRQDSQSTTNSKNNKNKSQTSSGSKTCISKRTFGSSSSNNSSTKSLSRDKRDDRPAEADADMKSTSVTKSRSGTTSARTRTRATFQTNIEKDLTPRAAAFSSSSSCSSMNPSEAAAAVAATTSSQPNRLTAAASSLPPIQKPLPPSTAAQAAPGDSTIRGSHGNNQGNPLHTRNETTTTTSTTTTTVAARTSIASDSPAKSPLGRTRAQRDRARREQQQKQQQKQQQEREHASCATSTATSSSRSNPKKLSQRCRDTTPSPTVPPIRKVRFCFQRRKKLHDNTSSDDDDNFVLSQETTLSTSTWGSLGTFTSFRSTSSSSSSEGASKAQRGSVAVTGEENTVAIVVLGKPNGVHAGERNGPSRLGDDGTGPNDNSSSSASSNSQHRHGKATKRQEATESKDGTLDRNGGTDTGNGSSRETEGKESVGSQPSRKRQLSNAATERKRKQQFGSRRSQFKSYNDSQELDFGCRSDGVVASESGGGGVGETTLSPAKVIRGAGSMNLFSVQDAGNWQMLQDEVLFLCSSVQTSMRILLQHSSSSVAGTTSSKASASSVGNGDDNSSLPRWKVTSAAPAPLPNASSILEAVADLALLLSNTKNRKRMFSLFLQEQQQPSRVFSNGMSHDTGASPSPTRRHGNDNGSLGSNNSPATKQRRGKSTHEEHAEPVLSAVLKTIGMVVQAMLRYNVDDEQATATVQSRQTKNSRISRQKEGRDSASGLRGTPSVFVLSPRIRRDILNAVAMMIHFLSVDCTMTSAQNNNASASSTSFSSHSSSGHAMVATAQTAKKVRHAILSNPAGLQGIVGFLLTDPIVKGLRGPNAEADSRDWSSTTSKNVFMSPVPAVHVPLRRTEKDVDDEASEMFSSVGESQQSSMASPSSLRSRVGSKKERGHDSAASHVASPPSVSSPQGGQASPDPTAVGRGRRRKRKGGDGRPANSKLETIDENASAKDSMDMDKKRKSLFENKSNEDHLSFNSATTTSKSSSRASKRIRTAAASGGPNSTTQLQNDKLSFSSGSKTKHDSATAAEAAAAALDDESTLDSQAVNARRTLQKVMTRFRANFQVTQLSVIDTSQHVCGFESGDEGMVASPLMALSRIISGKFEGENRSCLDDFDQFNTSMGAGSSGIYEMEDESQHPVLITNKLLNKCGTIPILAQAMAQTLDACIRQLRRQNQEGTAGSCPCCISYLYDRVAGLASLVDGACLLNDINRQTFCREGYTAEAGGYLVVGLVAVLKSLVESGKLQDEKDWGEIGLQVLRTLTSLTHENIVAAKEMEIPYGDLGLMFSSINNGSGCLLDVIVQVLQCSVRRRERVLSGAAEKSRYDSVILCLNTLANVVESGGDKALFVNMKAKNDNGEDVPFLSWLTDWLVAETATFRDAVSEINFGSSSSKHAERRLENHEDERLVTAGNGFVLVACLLNKSEAVEDAEFSATVTRLSNSIHEIVLEKLPGDTRHAKITFITNVMKAFCNFYHFSVGDLSVAIVDPVKKLIAQLKALRSDDKGSGISI